MSLYALSISNFASGTPGNMAVVNLTATSTEVYDREHNSALMSLINLMQGLIASWSNFPGSATLIDASAKFGRFSSFMASKLMLPLCLECPHQ